MLSHEVSTLKGPYPWWKYEPGTKSAEMYKETVKLYLWGLGF